MCSRRRGRRNHLPGVELVDRARVEGVTGGMLEGSVGVFASGDSGMLLLFSR